MVVCSIQWANNLASGSANSSWPHVIFINRYPKTKVLFLVYVLMTLQTQRLLLIEINNTFQSSEHREMLCKIGANELNLFIDNWFDRKTLKKECIRTNNFYSLLVRYFCIKYSTGSVNICFNTFYFLLWDYSRYNKTSI